MGKSPTPKKKAMLSLDSRKDVITIPFHKQEELIELVAEHLTYHYQRSLEYLKKDSINKYAEKAKQFPKLIEAFKVVIRRRLKFFKKVTITHRSLLIKGAFRKAKIKKIPPKAYKKTISYKIEGLEFQIIKERR